MEKTACLNENGRICVQMLYIAYTIFTAINVVLECILLCILLETKFTHFNLLVSATNAKHLVNLTQISYIYILFMV